LVRDQLKQKAQSISKVPSHYQLMIEDYGEKDEKERRAFFARQAVELPKRAISVKLEHHRRVLNVTSAYEPAACETL